MDFKDCKSDTPNTRIAAQPSGTGQTRFGSFEGAVEEASKNEEPVAASKQEEHTARTAVEEHHANVIAHLNNGDTNAAFQALMRSPNGRQLDYGESRRMYG